MTTNDHFRQRDMMRLTWSETIFSRIVPGIIATKMARGSHRKSGFVTATFCVITCHHALGNIFVGTLRRGLAAERIISEKL